MIEADTTTRAAMASGHRGLILPRLLIGLLQGLALYGLYWSVDHTPRLWPATIPELFGPLVLVAAYLPVVLLGGLGRLRLKTLLIWTGVAAATLALLGWHDMARQVLIDQREPFLSPPLFPFLAAALFIAHHLIVPADQEGRRIAAYPRYFDVAWKAGVQLALSVGFTGALWLLLFLGAGLFGLIGIRAFGELLAEPWFNLPVTSLTFALAVHLTDVRDGLIRGVRSVVLMLLSWLLPVIAVLTAAFLAALPFTGLSGLWDQGSATALMLSAAAVLIVLINAAYQDGTDDTRPPLVLRWAVIVGGLLLIPLVAVASTGLALRIGQHGLTPDRIVAAACILAGLAYALGYAWAAITSLRGRDWMQPLERTNVGTGALIVALIVLLFSPVLDPARLSVMDQMARLERGAVTPEQFDYRFLRFESGKVGRAALERLTKSDDPEIAKLAQDAQLRRIRWESTNAVEERLHPDRPSRTVKPVIEAWPKGTALPETFLNPSELIDDSRTGCRSTSDCVATLFDVDGDGRDEILMGTTFFVYIFVSEPDGVWNGVGSYEAPSCKEGTALIREGGIEARRNRWPGLTIGGIQLDFDGWYRQCPASDDEVQPEVAEIEEHGRLNPRGHGWVY
ncbi:DUF4153 domain-containing protein [Brevundimonas sp.]|uniref:DUF4153 domain-containing protein n=1 Tax=Brevundimonas sp. TaxID=1871086 RepID=UPI001D9B2417|nr:DUF4153 domain-containing protein [Brevundimonas sp.]MBL0947020.1 DUF4153 domain-containing protein [Brevundimonas sp.]